MIILDKITKAYKKNTVFENLSLEICDGDVVRIQGDNDTGKSVMMKLIAGYTLPDSGHITIDGLRLKKDIEFIHKAGLFVNAPEFMYHCSGLDNLQYLASFRNTVGKSEIMALAELLYFEKDILKKYRTYSLGMKQKMRIIQAIMEENKYLILDEPFDSLDKKSKEAVIELLSRYRSSETIIVYASHSDDFMKYTTKKIVIHDSKDISIVEC